EVGHRIRRCAGGPPARPCPDHGVGTDVAGGRARRRPIGRSCRTGVTAGSPTGTTAGTRLDYAPGPLKPATGLWHSACGGWVFRRAVRLGAGARLVGLLS